MDFMKVFDQTVREIKREVNLKVLKVPEIEQKVLDATDNEPWGPHGSALAEIALATKKFTECQMVMNVLWTRLTETGKDWRYVYKALAVIEYLVANGSERAVDDVVEHTFQISALTSFEYVEPSGKDVGINVRKKAENIITLLNNKDKIQEVRNKAASNRDKYFGLSSSGITYKSSSSAFGSGASLSSSDRYGGARDSDSFSGGYRERDTYRDSKTDEDDSAKNQDNTLKSKSGYHRREPQSTTSSASKSSTKSKDTSDYNSVPPHSSSINLNNYEADFDDFDPRGTSSSKVPSGGAPQVDLFGPNLIDDFMDAPTSAATEKPSMTRSSSDVDLFADATFVSAPSHAQNGSSSESQNNVDLFATQTTIPPVSSPVDLLAAPTPVTQLEAKSPPSSASNIVDPFAAVPLNTFDGSDLFGAFTSQSDPVSSEPSQNPPINGSDHSHLGGQSFTESKSPPKKDGFQVKSEVWADSLTRGLIDLNISAPKKVSLVDVGVVGGLSDMSDVREKGPPTYNMGRAMGAGSGLGRSGPSGSPTSSPAVGGDDFFSQLRGRQYQFGGFQK